MEQPPGLTGPARQIYVDMGKFSSHFTEISPSSRWDLTYTRKNITGYYKVVVLTTLFVVSTTLFVGSTTL